MRTVICSHPWHTTLLDNAITQVAMPSWPSHRHLASADSSFENFSKTRLAEELARTFDALRYRSGRIVNVTHVKVSMQAIAGRINFGSVLWKRFRIDVARDQIIKRTVDFERARIPMATAIVLACVPSAATQDPYTNKSMTNVCVGQCSISSKN